MKPFAIMCVLLALAMPAFAAVVHNETTNGDLSSNNAAPTPIAFAPGSNEVIGTVNGLPLDRDYITFTIAPNQVLSHLYLLGYSPENLAFSAFNAGSTSYIPSGSTSALFLSGIHIDPDDISQDLMLFFDTRSLTPNSLDGPSLGPGTYCWMIQQTSAVVQSYHVEFVIDTIVPTESSTWGKVKALYR